MISKLTLRSGINYRLYITNIDDRIEFVVEELENYLVKAKRIFDTLDDLNDYLGYMYLEEVSEDNQQLKKIRGDK